MIVLDLRCDSDHRFEAWFASAEAFSDQRARGLVECPACGSHRIERIPSAVHIGGKGHEGPASPLESPLVPASPLAVYQQFVAALLAASEDTGSKFAEEARRIHYREAPARAIHGESTQEDFEALREEGIEVVRLPVPAKSKLN